MDVKRVRSVASALQASTGLRKDNSKEVWGKQEVRHEIEAEPENAGTTAGSRGGSGFKERLKFPGVGTSGEDSRSRGYELGQNAEELRSGGEKPRSSGEKLRSSGEKLVFSGERRGSRGEKLGTSGEKLEGSRMGSINEEKIERVVEVTVDERLIEITDDEMDIPFEKVEENNEEIEEGVEVEEDVLDEVNDNTDESVSMEEKAYRQRYQ
ncbi:WD repeat-containing protein 87-like isoform X1 [Pontoporia blainvillei]|uniref:WD repeat-containing protein 87-like isoform X1 n=1 Tax=Pontoporia blainvillei TaxID=48723 RepID=A0ABX0SEK8_PONBL|nr:WD repeat-containing protein 87-like isoform X1 [Pontoporia blainvillei]